MAKSGRDYFPATFVGMSNKRTVTHIPDVTKILLHLLLPAHSQFQAACGAADIKRFAGKPLRGRNQTGGEHTGPFKGGTFRAGNFEVRKIGGKDFL